MISAAALFGLLALPVGFFFLREPWVWTAVAASWLSAAALFAIRALLRGYPSQIDSKTIALAFLPAVGALQLAAGLTVHAAATQTETLLWAAVAALFPAARAVLTDSVVRREFLRWSLVFAVIACVAALIQFSTSGGRIYWFIPTEQAAVLGPFRNRNHFASFAALFFPLALLNGLGSAPASDGSLRGPAWRYLVAAGTLAAAVAVGGSRAGIAIIMLETAVLLWLTGRRRAAIALAGVLLLAAPVALQWRGDGDRGKIWDSTLTLIVKQPGLGHGLGAFETAYPSEARFDNGLIVDHAHNDWLEFAAEAGILATLPLAGLAVWSAIAASRNWWALGVPAVFLHALVDYPLHKPALAGWLVVMIAALAAAEGQRMLLGPFEDRNGGELR